MNIALAKQEIDYHERDISPLNIYIVQVSIILQQNYQLYQPFFL